MPCQCSGYEQAAVYFMLVVDGGVAEVGGVDVAEVIKLKLLQLTS